MNFSSALVDTNYAVTLGGGTSNGRFLAIYNGTMNTSDSQSALATNSVRICQTDTSGYLVNSYGSPICVIIAR